MPLLKRVREATGKAAAVAGAGWQVEGEGSKKIALQCALQGSLAVRREAARSANAKDAA